MNGNRENCPMRHENGNCTVAGGFCTAVNDPVCEALHNAFDCGHRSAIRARQEVESKLKVVESNAPLTLDELRKMDGEPVWVEFQDGSGGCWGLVHITVFNHIVFANGLFCTIGKPYYGKTWLPYREKPKED